MTTDRCGLPADKCKCSKGCICIFLKNHAGTHRTFCGTVWGGAPVASPKGAKIGEPKVFQVKLPEPGLTTLHEAQTAFRLALRDGVDCKCCGRYAKIYPRNLNSGMARSLIVFYLHSLEKPGWFHALSVLQERAPSLHGCGDYGKLVHWELLEDSSDPRPDGNPENGMHRLTQKGIDFVLKKLAIPKYAFLYADTLIGVSEETTMINMCLGEDFNYDELMKA